MARPNRLDDLVLNLNNAGMALEEMLADPAERARLNPGELHHLAAALDCTNRAWDCLEHVAGVGPPVPGVVPLSCAALSATAEFH